MVIHFRSDCSRFHECHWSVQETIDNFNKLNHRDEKNNRNFFATSCFHQNCVTTTWRALYWLVKHRFQQIVPVIVDLKDFHEVSLVMSCLSISRFICIVITTSDHQCIALVLLSTSAWNTNPKIGHYSVLWGISWFIFRLKIANNAWNDRLPAYGLRRGKGLLHKWPQINLDEKHFTQRLPVLCSTRRAKKKIRAV